MERASALLNLVPYSAESAPEKAKELMERIRAKYGFVPNVYAGMAHSPGLLETYLVGYEQFREKSGLNPIEQEVVFLTISRFHRCRYCMAAHSLVADLVAKMPTDVLDAVRKGMSIPDPKLAALAAFTHAMVETRGMPTPEQVREFRAAGYTDRHALEIILALALKTMSNFSNHLLQPELEPAFRAYAWAEDPS